MTSVFDLEESLLRGRVPFDKLKTKLQSDPTFFNKLNFGINGYGNDAVYCFLQREKIKPYKSLSEVTTEGGMQISNAGIKWLTQIYDGCITQNKKLKFDSCPQLSDDDLALLLKIPKLSSVSMIGASLRHLSHPKLTGWAKGLVVNIHGCPVLTGKEKLVDLSYGHAVVIPCEGVSKSLVDLITTRKPQSLQSFHQALDYSVEDWKMTFSELKIDHPMFDLLVTDHIVTTIITYDASGKSAEDIKKKIIPIIAKVVVKASFTTDYPENDEPEKEKNEETENSDGSEKIEEEKKKETEKVVKENSKEEEPEYTRTFRESEFILVQIGDNQKMLEDVQTSMSEGNLFDSMFTDIEKSIKYHEERFEDLDIADQREYAQLCAAKLKLETFDQEKADRMHFLSVDMKKEENVDVVLTKTKEIMDCRRHYQKIRYKIAEKFEEYLNIVLEIVKAKGVIDMTSGMQEKLDITGAEFLQIARLLHELGKLIIMSLCKRTLIIDLEVLKSIVNKIEVFNPKSVSRIVCPAVQTGGKELTVQSAAKYFGVNFDEETDKSTLLLRMLQDYCGLVELPVLRKSPTDEHVIFTVPSSLPTSSAPRKLESFYSNDKPVDFVVMEKKYIFVYPVAKEVLAGLVSSAAKYGRTLMVTKEGAVFQMGSVQTVVKSSTHDGNTMILIQSKCYLPKEKVEPVNDETESYVTEYTWNIFCLYTDLMDKILFQRSIVYLTAGDVPKGLVNKSIGCKHVWKKVKGKFNQSVCTMCNKCCENGRKCQYNGIMGDNLRECLCKTATPGCVDCGICVDCASELWEVRSYLRPNLITANRATTVYSQNHVESVFDRIPMDALSYNEFEYQFTKAHSLGMYLQEVADGSIVLSWPGPPLYYSGSEVNNKFKAIEKDENLDPVYKLMEGDHLKFRISDPYRVNSKDIGDELDWSEMNQFKGVYFPTIVRDIKISHETGLLCYEPNSKTGVVGQIIGPEVFSDKFRQFSFQIVKHGKYRYIGIGVCDSGYSPNRMPGWNSKSYGYHADDGGLFMERSASSKKSTSLRCSEGDIMSVYCNMNEKSIKFFRNDKLVYEVPEDQINEPKYGFRPIVGLHSVGECVRLLEKEPWTTRPGHTVTLSKNASFETYKYGNMWISPTKNVPMRQKDNSQYMYGWIILHNPTRGYVAFKNKPGPSITDDEDYREVGVLEPHSTKVFNYVRQTPETEEVLVEWIILDSVKGAELSEQYQQTRDVKLNQIFDDTPETKMYSHKLNLVKEGLASTTELLPTFEDSEEKESGYRLDVIKNSTLINSYLLKKGRYLFQFKSYGNYSPEYILKRPKCPTFLYPPNLRKGMKVITYTKHGEGADDVKFVEKVINKVDEKGNLDFLPDDNDEEDDGSADKIPKHLLTDEEGKVFERLHREKKNEASVVLYSGSKDFGMYLEKTFVMAPVNLITKRPPGKMASQDTLPERRLRVLTEKAKPIFEERVNKSFRRLAEQKANIEAYLDHIDIYKEEHEKLKETRDLIHEGMEKFLATTKEFNEYLDTQNTKESLLEISGLNQLYAEVDNNIKVGLRQIDKILTPTPKSVDKPTRTGENAENAQPSIKSEPRSSRHSRQKHRSQSGNSRSSYYSHSSRSILLEKKTKLEVAKAKLEMIEQEEKVKQQQNELETKAQEERALSDAQLKKKQFEYSSTLNILKHKREMLEAEAELTAAKEVLQSEMLSSTDRESSLGLPEESSQTKVEKYVSQHRLKQKVIPETLDYEDVNPEKNDSGLRPQRLNPTVKEFCPRNINSVEINNNVQTIESTDPIVTTLSTNYRAETHSTVSDLTKYIIKKDLLLSRLTPFDDRPERYFSWKNSFQNITREFETTSIEELDLLIRWLGPQSKKQATSLRVSNAQNESKGLDKIWKRLDERYGAPEKVASSLKERLDKFPRINQNEQDKLYELSDLLSEILSVKENPHYSMVLAYFDSSFGVNAIASKLPLFIQNKWIDHASRYKMSNSVMYPPFVVFVEFVHATAVRMNDPSFQIRSSDIRYDNVRKERKPIQFNNPPKPLNQRVTVTKTDIDNHNGKIVICPLHTEGDHTLGNCRTFLRKSIDDKKKIVQKSGICFKCLKGKHLAKACKENIECEKCSSRNHSTPFHIDRKQPDKDHGGERNKTSIETKCTQVCGNQKQFKGKSCAKTLLVRIYPIGKPELSLQTYATIDDQSNRSLAQSELFDYFDENSERINYTLKSCAGKSTCTGRIAKGYILESLDGEVQLNCPTLLECNEIPNSKHEIATPAVARQYAHLQDLEGFIPEIDSNSDILLLIGRDMMPAHHVMDQRIGKDNEPYGQKLRLGWAIIGESCLGLIHTSDTVTVNKTAILANGRETHLEPCEYGFQVKDNIGQDTLGPVSQIFKRTPEDDTPGLSQEDREFLSTMENEFVKSESGRLSAPLPFRKHRQNLPNNYIQAKQRADNLARNLKRDKVKQSHFLDFMRKVFSNKHAEDAPPLLNDQEAWYLPIFGVYNAKKPSKIRVVFDSSAQYEGICLNDVLLKGPDFTNSLVGVLLRFRKGKYAATADVEQMFFNFEVIPEHRDYLRFIWFENNDMDKPLKEYRMKVHVFGSSPSPAVATFGLRKAVCDHNESECDDVCRFVRENFYVDDALVSADRTEDIVYLLRSTRDRLIEGGAIRLHKIVSNSAEVLSSFSQKDLAEGINEMDFDTDSTYLQRSLGLSWDVIKDTFTFRLSPYEKPFTKRGLLSVINGVFDPLGFAAPVILGGRLILRRAIQDNSLQWDDQLPSALLTEWQDWKLSLKDLQDLEIERPYTDLSFDEHQCELYVFADASKEAVAAVAYIRVFDNDQSKFGFIMGKSKLAPNHGHTIPRLELCAALLATEIATFIQKQLNISTNKTHFYTDSQVVLGYLNNETRRFYVYVSNRVDRILKASTKQQWHYISTELNPADFGTRPLDSNRLNQSVWLNGPTSFVDSHEPPIDSFQMVEPENDKEVVPLVQVRKTMISSSLDTDIFKKFSSWTRLVNDIACLKQLLSRRYCTKNNTIDNRTKVDFLKESEVLIIKAAQNDWYNRELDSLTHEKSLPKNSNIIDLSPVLDSNETLRVGGRLGKAKLETGEKTPIIIPGKSNIATLIVRHYHELVLHQGRHITEGSIRSNGFWITGGKRLINSVLSNCIQCKKLRGKVAQQKMGELPSDRISPTPPFTCVAVDCFGPWNIVSRRTRGGLAQAKRWAVIFSCLVTRAIHIEVLEDMSSSSFINALRRFVALRGPVSEFRSDQGTNFVGAVNELGIQAINVQDPPIVEFLSKRRILWRFSPPQASNMNGAVERMIGLTRRILDSMFMDNRIKQLTHEVLCTLMAEVCCIINSRPLVPVSSDPMSPTILTPNVLLTHKLNHSDVDSETIRTFEQLSLKDMYKAQWKQVQILANQFWKQWNCQYLHNLQRRKKWPTEGRNFQKGDVVVMVDDTVPRNQWSLGVIDDVFPSESDGLVRKASVCVIRDDDLLKYSYIELKGHHPKVKITYDSDYIQGVMVQDGVSHKVYKFNNPKQTSIHFMAVAGSPPTKPVPVGYSYGNIFQAWNYIALLTHKLKLPTLDVLQGTKGDLSFEHVELLLYQLLQSYASLCGLYATQYGGLAFQSAPDDFSEWMKDMWGRETTIKEIHDMTDPLEEVFAYRLGNYLACRAHGLCKADYIKLPNYSLEGKLYKPYISVVDALSIRSQSLSQPIPSDMFRVMMNLRSISIVDVTLDNTEIPKDIAMCKSLEIIIWSNIRGLTKLPKDVFCPPNLTSVYIDNCPIKSLDITWPTSSKMRSLTLRGLLVENIPAGIGNFAILEELRLDYNPLTTLPMEIEKLTCLKLLSVKGIPWLTLDGKLEQMSKVMYMNWHRENPYIMNILSEEKVIELFEEHDENSSDVIDKMQLVKLNTHFLFSIARLGLFSSGDKEFGGIPSVILKLKSLEKLDLSYTAITCLPGTARNIDKLQTIHLDHCPLLESIDGNVGLLPSLKAFHLNSCPSLDSPPQDIVGRGFGAVKSYLQKMAGGFTESHRTKLMFIGLGQAGKTTLLRALQSERKKYSGTTPKLTDGIEIKEWKVPVEQDGRNIEITYSCWDFAGQTVYYNTHQFFLSKQAVYMLLWNMRMGFEHAGLDFWLSSIVCHCPDTPVIVVGTQLDQIPMPEIREDELMKKYPQIKKFCYVSSTNGTNIAELEKALIDITLNHCPQMTMKIPLLWLQLEGKILFARKDRKNILDWETLVDMSSMIGISDEQDIKLAIQFLDDLGIVQYFDTEVLSNKVVINPQWIVDVMAKVVSVNEKCIKENKGRFYHSFISQVWKNYDPTLHEWLLKLTEAFDLTFPIPVAKEAEKFNIVPCLLPEKEPADLPWPYLPEEEGFRESKIEYKFTYLPTGLFNRAQARLFSQGFTMEEEFLNLMWKRGFILKKNGHYALVKQISDFKMVVLVEGARPKNILDLIHETISTLIKDSFEGVDYDYYIPCPDCVEKKEAKDPHLFKAELIHRAHNINAPFLQCTKYFHTVSTGELLNALPDNREMEFDIQMQQSISALQEISTNMAKDVAILYCPEDIPTNNKGVNPKDIHKDLKKAGFSCWYPEDMSTTSDVEMTMEIKNSMVLVVCISDQFVANLKCHKMFLYATEQLQKPIAVAVIAESLDWQQTDIGMKIGNPNMAMIKTPERYPKKILDLIDIVRDCKKELDQAVLDHPPVFISYCWTNSKEACSVTTQAKPGSLGYGDPRVIKKHLEKNGIRCWLDIEQLGRKSLFQDITVGLQNARVIVVCVSDEYLKSDPCMMEARFGTYNLQLPLVVCVVGTGKDWKMSEVSLMVQKQGDFSTIVKMQKKNSGTYDQVVEHVKNFLQRPETSKQKKIREKLTKLQKKQEKMIQEDVERQLKQQGDNKFSFQEEVELIQRKFLRHITMIIRGEGMGNDLPKLLVFDFIPSDPPSEPQPDDMGSMASLSGGFKSKAQPKKAAIKSGQKEEWRNEKFCVKLLCEDEQGWHVQGEPLSLANLRRDETIKVLSNASPYLARLYAILKQSSVLLNCLNNSPKAESFMDFIRKEGIETKNLNDAYKTIQTVLVDHTDQETFTGQLSRCYQQTGKISWLCAKHHNKTGITLLPAGTINIHGGTGHLLYEEDILMGEYLSYSPGYQKFKGGQTLLTKKSKNRLLKRDSTVKEFRAQDLPVVKDDQAKINQSTKKEEKSNVKGSQATPVASQPILAQGKADEKPANKQLKQSQEQASKTSNTQNTNTSIPVSKQSNSDTNASSVNKNNSDFAVTQQTPKKTGSSTSSEGSKNSTLKKNAKQEPDVKGSKGCIIM